MVSFATIDLFPLAHSNEVTMISRLIARFRGTEADTKEVYRGTVIAFSIKVLSAASTFLMTLVVTRQLGAQQAGLLFLAQTIVVIASALARLGLDNTFVRFIAANHVMKEWAKVRGLYDFGTKWALVVSVLFAAVIVLVAEPLAVHVFAKPQFADVITILALTIPGIALLTLDAKALQGLKRISQAMFVFSAARPIAIMILVLAFSPSAATETSWVFVAAVAVTFALGRFWWSGVVEIRGVASKFDRGQVLASCMPLLMVVVLVQTTTWASQILLGIWGTSEDVAVFNAAQRTAMLTSFVLVAVNSIVAPKFAAMHRTGKAEALRRTAKLATRLMFAIALVPLAILLLFPVDILSLFGSEFAHGSTALRILALGQFINVATGSVAFLLTMTGHERLLRNNTFAAAVVALCLGIILIPIYELNGAAIATACGVATSNLLSAFQVRRVLGFNTMAIWK